MKKTFKLQDLDCANCAAKIADENFDSVWKEVKKKAKKANPDVTILD